jgi:opacity protein-like surface antigen
MNAIQKTLIVGCMACLASAAFADENLPHQGAYIRLTTGWAKKTSEAANLFEVANGVVSTKSAYRNGYANSAALGYHAGPMRYEIEFGYLHNAANDFNRAGTALIRPNGHANAIAYLGNVFYEWERIHPSWVPYAGAGLGGVSVNRQIDTASYVNQVSGHTHSLAGQAIFGARYQYSNGFSLGLDYRYLRTGSSDYKIKDVNGALQTAHKPYSAHMLNLALLFDL